MTYEEARERLRPAIPPPEPVASRASGFSSAYVVTALNPKGIVFFVAFMPQFVRPSAPAAPQLVLLGATFVVLATVNASLYALFAGRFRQLIATPRAHAWFNRCGGTALIGAGVAAALARRSP
jgi:threonine/homoserine/homoserine lactone efflux protein